MFRRQKSNKKLSADELKSKLYAHFDKSGSINQLRTQIRSQLASELFKMASASTTVSEHNKTVDIGNTLLPLQVCNWLVYDHLIRQGYQYTLSTFVSETNLPYPEKLLAVGDILALVGLDNSSSEYKRISDLYSNSNDKEGLHSLLLAIIKSVIFIADKDNQQFENVLNSSHETDVKQKLPLKGERQGFADESGVFLKGLGEKTPRIKELNEATSLDSSYYDQLQSIREEREKEIQSLRHKLVQELERLHLQEQSFVQEIEQERREIRKERDLLFNEREKLKDNKDLFLKEQENKVEKKIREVEEMHIAKLYGKDKEIAALNNILKEKEMKLRDMEFELSTYKEKFDSLKQDLDDASRMYKSVHEKYNSLLDENTNLVKKFESMSDYNILKDELVSKGREISNLQREIEKLLRAAENNKKAYTETVASLELKLKAIEPKLQQLQKELNQKNNTFDMEKAIWDKEKIRLEQDSLTSKESYRTVLQKIEEQKKDIHDLHQAMHILHYQLTSGNTNQSASSEIHDSFRTYPKVPFLPKNNPISKSKNNPYSIAQKHKEKALSFTSDYKSKFEKLQQEMNECLDRYSLIHHTSINSKIPNIKPVLFHNSAAFTRDTNFTQPSFVKNISNTSSDFHLAATKNFTLGSLNLQQENITFPRFLNRYIPSQSSETLTSAQSIFDNTKAFVSESTNQTSIGNNIYVNKFPFQSEETIEPSSSTNLMNEKNQALENFKSTSFLPTRIYQDNLYATNTIENSSIEKAQGTSTGLTGNFLEDIPIAETVSTKDAFEVIPNTQLESFQNTFLSNRTNQNSFIANKNTDSSSGEILKTVSTELTENLFKNTPVTETISTELQENNLKTISKTLESVENFSNTTGVPLQSSFLLPSTSGEFSFQSNNSNTKKPIVPTSSNFKDTTLPQTSSLPMTNIDLQEQHTLPQTSVPKTNTDLLKQQTAAPIIVDLDAAWKSKTSLPSVNPPLFKSSNPLLFAKNTKTPDESILKGEMTSPPDVSTKAHQHTPVPLHTDNVQSLAAEQNDMKDSEQSKDFIENQVKFSPVEEFVEKGESQNKQSVAVSDVSGTDEDTKNERKSYHESQIQGAIRQTPEESLSELSEVHVSCGSEQEEQKEESDNW